MQGGAEIMGTPGFLQAYKVIDDFLNEYYRRFGSKIVKYQICYSNQFDSQTNNKAILSIIVWLKNLPEPIIFQNWYLVEDHWEKA